MMNLPAIMNRHVAGVSALVAALVVLGYAANTATNRRVAALPEDSPAIARQVSPEAPEARQAATVSQQASSETANANGWTQASGESTTQRLKDQIRALIPSMGSNSAQKEATNWNAEEWRIAEKAVADHRGASKTANNTTSNANSNARSEMVWQPPEEIAGRQATPSR